LLERPTGKQVEEAQEAPRLTRHVFSHGRPIDTGSRDENPDPVDGDHPQREKNSAPELGDSEDVRDSAHESVRAFS
jgi:hypothetical protein